MDMQALAMVEFMRTTAAWPLWAALGGLLLTLIVVIALARGSKTLANVVLAAISLGAIAAGVLAYNGVLVSSGGMRSASSVSSASDMPQPSHPALACLDGMAGEVVEAACARAIFSSPELTAAALSYTAAQLTRLSEAGARGNAESPDIFMLRKALETDRFGLVARVLEARDKCTLTRCEAFSYLTDSSNVARHLKEQTYQATVARYASAWGSAPAMPALASVPPAAAAPSAPSSGAPSNVEFPSASSIPPVSIMNNEPGAPPAAEPAAPSKRATSAPAPARKPATANAQPAANSPANAAPKSATPKPPASRPQAARPAAPVQIAPADQDDN